MMIKVEMQAMHAVPARGWATMAALLGSATAVTVLAAECAADAAGESAAIRRSVDVIASVLDRLADCRARLEQMVNAVGPDPWLTDLFASETEFFQAMRVLAGLAHPSSLPSTLAELIARVERLDADRTWMNAQTIDGRMRFLALLSVRWLPELSATGAANCLQGVLRNFQALEVGEPDSFASLVDAVILVSFQQGIARIVKPESRENDEPGAEQWQAFFEHRRLAEASDWDDASFRLWALAEQAATEAGYQWAVDRNVTTTQDLALMTQGAEVFRWVNRQRGLPSDPVRAIGRVADAGTGIATIGLDALSLGRWGRSRRQAIDVASDQLYWALDPRNPSFTYEAAQVIATAHALPLGGYAESVVTAPGIQQQSARDRRMMDRAGERLAAVDEKADAICARLPDAVPGCVS